MKTSLSRHVTACSLLAVALWLAADPALAQESVIAPIGEQFNSWIQVFEVDIYPVLVSVGLIIGVAICCFVSLKFGAFAIVGVIVGALIWGARETITNLGT